MITTKKEIDVEKLRTLLEDQPKLKKQIQNALNCDRQKISKILNRKQGIEAGELLTIAEILAIDPMELALS